MTHELGHMLGMKHCTYFSCVMNGSNSLPETDAQPAALCPVCLHKLLVATGVDPLERYESLGRLYALHGLDPEAAWVAGRLAALRPGGTSAEHVASGL